MKNMNGILELVKGLSDKDKKQLVQRIVDMMGIAGNENSCQRMVEKERGERPDCPHCAAKAELGYIVKRGTNRNGAQRYYCKKCGSIFVAATNTAFSRTRKNAETWRKFIEMTLDRKSLAECAKECNICIQTAFNWRHKVMNVFVVNQEDTQMSGNVEVDEMQLAISYKGNRIKGNFGRRIFAPGVDNGLPRDAFKRGTDNKSKYHRDKACIFCMVQDGNKGFYAAVPGTGFMTDKMLDATVAKHIIKEKAFMLADDYNTTKKYFEKNGYKHMILKSNVSDNPKDHKVEVKDGLHIQHANNMHSQIRRFLKPYYGVSSKYLAHYVAMYAWLKTIKTAKHRKTPDQISISRASSSDCYIPYKEIKDRPLVPTCA